MKWKEKLIDFAKDFENRGLHLAVFCEPYLSLLLDGEKKIESRFSINKISPHGRILEGDIVFVKKTGGPVIGYFEAGEIKSYSNLNKEKLCELKSRYAVDICSSYDPEFWDSRNKSNYATFVKIKKMKRISPQYIEKKDRTSWIVLKQTDSIAFSNEK
ncbi:ASCH domain-containing protein [Maribellus maritimus]|uniref:ASCH domain-containing protein n=1 Tax=Maribellus maritimus TaxID=2870838 RepID=UPI001EEA31A2|nr:ASCH domain-containing protein [Maribellus maritimus]MCG6190203.1 ASCH domain-containing protein [Maribellus maritimus]